MGRAWKFGDNISTDLIAPGRYYHLRSNLPELAKHVLEDARKEFAERVQPGDFVVADRNFGKGSSREHAVIILKMAGIRAILASSFARIFFRNCINNGLPAIVCDTEVIRDGDALDLDLAAGLVYDRTSSTHIGFAPLPPVMEAILREGGLAEYIRKHGDLTLDVHAAGQPAQAPR